MLLGYARISKTDGSQTLDLQRDALQAVGVAPERLYEDRMSGRHDARPGLEACLKALREGDALCVWKLDRLGRNLRHLVETVDDLQRRGVGLRVLTGEGAAIDTASPSGKLIFAVFAALAEFERDLISERTRAGLDAARARGRKGGRPRKMTAAKIRVAMAAMTHRDARPGHIAEELGITTTTLYAYVNGDGSPKAAATAILEHS